MYAVHHSFIATAQTASTDPLTLSLSIEVSTDGGSGWTSMTHDNFFGAPAWTASSSTNPVSIVGFRQVLLNLPDGVRVHIEVLGTSPTYLAQRGGDTLSFF